MGENEVMSGLGGLPAVYLSVHQLGNPSGQKMKDIGGGIWSITLKLKPGVYDYKFRNGLHNEWSGSGWENGKTIGEGGCGYDRHSNRRFRVTNKKDYPRRILLVRVRRLFRKYDPKCIFSRKYDFQENIHIYLQFWNSSVSIA